MSYHTSLGNLRKPSQVDCNYTAYHTKPRFNNNPNMKNYEISFNMTCQIIISIQISHHWLLNKYARFLYRIENEHFLLNLHLNSY